MFIENEKILINDLQKLLRKVDQILSNHLYNDFMSTEEKKLAVELQTTLRKGDKILNFYLNEKLLSFKDKDKLINSLLSLETQLSSSNSVSMPTSNDENEIVDIPTINEESVSIIPSKLQQLCSTNQPLAALVTKILIEIGIPLSIKGFTYIREGIIMGCTDTNCLHFITKQVYPEIAKKYKATSHSVERNIRHAIEVAWTRGNLQFLEDLFGNTISPLKGKPTNSEFLAMLVDQIRLNRGFF